MAIDFVEEDSVAKDVVALGIAEVDLGVKDVWMGWQ